MPNEGYANWRRVVLFDSRKARRVGGNPELLRWLMRGWTQDQLAKGKCHAVMATVDGSQTESLRMFSRAGVFDIDLQLFGNQFDQLNTVFYIEYAT